mgnify:CR=1 FL=1
MQLRLNIATALIMVQCCVLIAWPLPEMLSGHSFLEDWPSHAKFHVIWGSGTLLALSLIVMIVSWFGLRKGEKSAWFVTLIFTVGAQWTVIPARSLYHGPDWGMVIVGSMVPLVALILSAKPVFKGSIDS